MVLTSLTGAGQGSWILRGELWHALPLILDNMPPSHKREQMEKWCRRYGFTSRFQGRLFGRSPEALR